MELTLLRSTLPTGTLIILLLFSAARGSAARHRAIDRPGFAATPQQARDAVSASLGAARGALALVARLSSAGDGPRAPAPAPPEAAALGDCAVALGDAVLQLQRSLDALAGKRGGEELPRARSTRAEVDDAETWASAALTDENMCAQGLAAVDGEGEAKRAVARRVADAAERTSNALALINGLSSTAP